MIRILVVLMWVATAAPACLHAAGDLVGDPAKPAWPRFPRPAEVLVQSECGDFPSRVLQETAAGLAAYHARKSSLSCAYVWIEQHHHADYATWFADWKARNGVPIHPLDPDVWTLVGELRSRGIIAGYVLYRADHGGGAPYSERPVDDLSVNRATSVCGALSAIAIEESQQARADALGLKMLADARGQDEAWVLRERGETGFDAPIAQLDARASIARDMAVACGSPVIQNFTGQGRSVTLAHARPGLAFGWGAGQEDVFVHELSAHGSEMVAANWSYNLPLLASNAAPIVPQNGGPGGASLGGSDPAAHYVAFIESDGDNITWVMGNFFSGRNFFAHPDRGRIPFAWTVPVPVLHALGSDAWNHLVRGATANDDVVQIGLCGYGFVDETPEAALRAQASALEPCLERANVHGMVGFTHVRWDSPDSRRGFAAVAENCPALHGILPLQYWPYAAGQGAMYWCTSANGRKIPVLSPRTEIRRVDHPSEVAGPPEHAARLLNEWVARPGRAPEDRFAWVIVHAWSDFGGGVTGVGAAKACAEHLDPRIKVVKPSELVERLYREANR